MSENSKYWKYVERGRRRFIGKYTRKLTKDMRSVIDPIIAMLKYSPSIEAIKLMPDNLIRTDRINDTLVEMYGAVGAYFGSRVENQVKKNLNFTQWATRKSVEEDRLWSDWLEQFAFQRAGVKYLSINKTIRSEASSMINRLIYEAQRDGLGIEETARKIEKELGRQWGIRSMSHARMVAQTEITTASNTVSNQAIEFTGYNYRKTWVTSPDGIIKHERHRLRGAIAEFTVMKNEKYMVDGGQGPKPMRYPGDPEGSVENIVNCHCCEVYEII